MLTEDLQVKAEQLKALWSKSPDTDGGTEALFELGLLKVRQWKSPQAQQQDKDKYLGQARDILSSFITKYPESLFSREARGMLAKLPEVE